MRLLLITEKKIFIGEKFLYIKKKKMNNVLKNLAVKWQFNLTKIKKDEGKVVIG